MKRKLGTREWQYCCDEQTRGYIRKLHDQFGWTYKQLAEHCNISKSTAARYCRGTSQSKYIKSQFDYQTDFD
jgi:response regulator of citrate/malate metabolism